MMRSFSANAVEVGAPVQFMAARVVPNSTPSLYGPPPISDSEPAAVLLNTRTLPPQFAAVALSCAHMLKVMVPESVNPPAGTRPLIHSNTEPPAVLVH